VQSFLSIVRPFVHLSPVLGNYIASEMNFSVTSNSNSATLASRP
jgi:hypothetical protein